MTRANPRRLTRNAAVAAMAVALTAALPSAASARVARSERDVGIEWCWWGCKVAGPFRTYDECMITRSNYARYYSIESSCYDRDGIPLTGDWYFVYKNR